MKQVALLLFGTVFLTLVFADVTNEEVEKEKSYERNVTAFINPKCPGNECHNFTLIHVEQRGRTDTLHNLWSFSKIFPTVFYARTDLDTTLDINWPEMFSGNHSQAISFSKKPQYFAAVILSKFMIYNDLGDSGLIPNNNSENVMSLDPQLMEWQLKSLNCSSNTSATAVFRLSSYDGSEAGENTNVEVTLTAYGGRNRGSLLPHLAFTENSTQLDFTAENVEIPTNFSNARLAIELSALASEPTESQFSMVQTRSLDDEYTPGVFKLIEVRSALHQHFLQWRPVCYTSTNRDIGDSTGLTQSVMINITDRGLLDNSLLDNLNLGVNLQSLALSAFNVSFGVEGDGFYQKSNYTAWTMVTGHGSPLGDEFSLMVILVMTIGLGFPALVLFIGGMAIAIRNYKNGKDDLLFEQLNN